MVRWIKPGLVALYNISSGNGVGLFLQPWADTGPLLILGREYGENLEEQMEEQEKAVSHPVLDHPTVCCWQGRTHFYFIGPKPANVASGDQISPKICHYLCNPFTLTKNGEMEGWVGAGT